MIESTGVTSLIYQEQVARENQIQRDQVDSQKSEDQSSSRGSADVTSFSAEGLELAKTAVTATEETPEVELEQQAQEEVVVPERQASNSSFAQHLDIQA